jgi:hypothetical protein
MGSVMVVIWRFDNSRLRPGSVTGTRNNFLHDALSAATQFNCRQLLGRVYYTYLARIKQSTYTVRAGTAGPIPRVSGSMFPNPDGLAPEHMLRILTGNW